MEIFDPGTRARQRAVGVWLLVVCAMVFAMIVLGGVTRLTYSGLSMVEWKPLTGWLPPLSAREWEAAFADYQQFPEFKLLNAGITMAEFQTIFLIEFFHRLWGRLIGVAFLAPFVVFFMRRSIDSRLLPKLLAMFVLGGLQGALGWYMVKSGLVDEPDVSSYRLTAHLGFAVIIYGYILWVALGLLSPVAEREVAPAPRALRRFSIGIVVIVFLTILAGGFVAGTDAGFAYNTFPTMDGEWVPSALFAMDPWYINFFEDVTTVQFDHRLLALVTTAMTVVYWLRSRGIPLTPRARLAANLMVVMVLAQVALGAFTVVLIVPVPLAALHQAGAVALFTLALWNAWETCGDDSGD